VWILVCLARWPDVVKDLLQWQVYFLVDLLTTGFDLVLSSSSSSSSSTHFVDSTGDEEDTEDAQEDADELLEDMDGRGRKPCGQLFKSFPSDGRLMLSGVRGEELSLYALTVEQ